jgi:hypothetical protein
VQIYSHWMFTAQITAQLLLHAFGCALLAPTLESNARSTLVRAASQGTCLLSCCTALSTQCEIVFNTVCVGCDTLQAHEVSARTCEYRCCLLFITLTVEVRGVDDSVVCIGTDTHGACGCAFILIDMYMLLPHSLNYTYSGIFTAVTDASTTGRRSDPSDSSAWQW